MPNTDMKQAALLSLYGIGNAGTGYQNPAPALLIVIILLPVSILGTLLERRLRYAGFGN